MSGKTAVATAVPADARTAEIVAIAPPDDESEVARVAVANTEPYIKYSLLAFDSLGAAPVNLGNGVNGKGDGELVLEGGEPKFKFFKLARSGIRPTEGGQGQ